MSETSLLLIPVRYVSVKLNRRKHAGRCNLQYLNIQYGTPFLWISSVGGKNNNVSRFCKRWSAEKIFQLSLHAHLTAFIHSLQRGHRLFLIQYLLEIESGIMALVNVTNMVGRMFYFVSFCFSRRNHILTLRLLLRIRMIVRFGQSNLLFESFSIWNYIRMLTRARRW